MLLALLIVIVFIAVGAATARPPEPEQLVVVVERPTQHHGEGGCGLALLVGLALFILFSLLISH